MKLISMFALLLIFANLLTYVSSAFVKSRTWHEEFSTHRADSRQQEILFHQVSSVLYPRFKRCISPKEKPEKLKQKSQKILTKSSESSWSELLSIYAADSGAEIYNWDFYKHTIDPKKATRLNQLLTIFIFIGLFIVIFTVFVFLVPITGRYGFKFYSLVWLVMFHPEMRRLVRRLIITKEKITRKMMHLLLPKTTDKTKQSKRQFRLPFAFREYEDEEVPAELIHSEEDSDGGEASSDGFENLLLNKGKRDAGDKTDAAALRYFMASAETELQENEKQVQEEAALHPAESENRQ